MEIFPPCGLYGYPLSRPQLVAGFDMKAMVALGLRQNCHEKRGQPHSRTGCPRASLISNFVQIIKIDAAVDRRWTGVL